MARIEQGIDLSGGRSDSNTFLIVFGLMIAGFFIGQFVSSMFIFLFAAMSGNGLEAMTNIDLLFESISNTQLMIAQSTYTLVFTFLTPWFYLKLLAKKSIGDLYLERKTPILPLVLTSVATVAFMFFNNLLIEWNANMSLPDFMSGIEEWMQNMEEQLAETTEAFTTFDNFGQFLFAFVVVAILPGIGEEWLFRGVLQNSLHRWSKNVHLAVWLSAFIFAAIHLQFYGVLPRMMLGVLFGYLYVWSGNLWYPIAAHIINNGLSLTFAYLYQLDATNINIDESETLPAIFSIIGFVVCAACLYVFRNHYLKQNSLNE